MARDIAEIKQTMTNAFMADGTVKERYGLSESDTFDDSFSVVSIENILFYIVAACSHVLEVLFDQFKADVDDKISRAVVASVPWYYKIAKEFQYGDALIFNEATQQYGYEQVSEKKRVVKYVAVRDRGTSIEILASGEIGGHPAVLSDDVLTAFKQYLNRVKIAGVVLSVRSFPADRISINATIHVDPLVIDRTGVRIADGSYAVEDAVNSYVRKIIYGGTFNKTKLVDAIQNVEGVLDVELHICKYSTDGTIYKEISGNNYTAVGGSFVTVNLRNTLNYVV